MATIDRIERERRNGPDRPHILLSIFCKDARELRFQLPPGEESEKAYTVLVHYAYPEHMKYLFAFDHKRDKSVVSLTPRPPYL